MAERKEAKQRPVIKDKRQPTEDEIRKRAYAIYCARNGSCADEVDDWLKAETELKEERMTGLFENILCPVDFDENSIIAAQAARDLLQGPEGRLYLLHIMHFRFALTDKEATTPLSDAKRKLEKIAREHLGGRVRYEILVENSDDTAKSILEAARRLPCGCIVMATHGRRKGMDRFLIGSIAQRVVRESPKPVLTIRPEPDRTSI